jgi:DNA-binding transcriptional MerR regulator
MRISELSRRSGVPLATVKYYQRERLLRPGTATAANQATYDETHLHRLHLIRTLIEVGRLATRDVRSVVQALENPRRPIHGVLGVAHYALSRQNDGGDADGVAAANADVGRLLADLAWRVEPRAPGRSKLARAIASLRRLGWNVTRDTLAPYARAADSIAAHEIKALPTTGTPAELVERMVVGTVAFEQILSALRLLAQEHHSARRFGRSRRPGA